MNSARFSRGSVDRNQALTIKYGVTHAGIFSGGEGMKLTDTYCSLIRCQTLEMALKKMNDESAYRSRFIWIDGSSLSFHW